MPRRAIVFMSFLTVASGCSSPDLQDYSSTEFKFKARFVGVPKTSTKTAPFGGKIYKYSSDTGDGSLIVETIELTPAESTSDSVLQDRLDAALEQMARNYGASLRSRGPCSLDGKFPGREFIAVNGSGVIRGRIYLVNWRLYQVMVIGPEKFIKGSLATEFMNSFNLI